MSCRFRVKVTARNRHPVAHLASRSCHTTKLARLTYGQAKRELRREGDAVAGKATEVEAIRLGRLSFEGWATWGKPRAGTTPAETCTLEMSVRMRSWGAIEVEADEPKCEPAEAHGGARE